MCGIAGVILPKGQAPDLAVLTLMRDALSHRGPDDAGIEIMGNVGVVHTRLSIIDVAGGHQPLMGKQKKALVVNGEIFNYVETVFPVYEAYGEETFTQHLRGMYALCLHDPKAGKTLLSRDLFGIKPLYFAKLEEGGIAFASEASALLKSGLAKKLVNPRARAQAFQLGFTLGDQTVSGFIKRVLPGETLVI